MLYYHSPEIRGRGSVNVAGFGAGLFMSTGVVVIMIPMVQMSCFVLYTLS